MKIDHIHFYVEDALLWRDWFIYHLGFRSLITHTHSFHTCTKAVTSGSINFFFSSPILATSPVATFLSQHPPGVADVAFIVEDIVKVIELAEASGSKILQSIQQYQHGSKSYKWGKIGGWGSLTHTLLEISDSNTFTDNQPMDLFSMVRAIDHVVLNVEAGKLETAVSMYQSIFNLELRQQFNIQTAYSALHSQVLTSSCGNVQLPINEPTSNSSQIQEFLDFNRGSGIQHIALQTNNAIQAIAKFRVQGLSFLPVPANYYLKLQQRHGFSLSPQELQAIAQQQILVDWEPETPQALLLQIFTQYIFAQPTFFLEFIERRSQASGFGEGNFQALFAAMEAEQIQRGSLQI
ncbi:MAG: 4-hydroxyphenylpyruvate dioxygenase [Richelia sp.]|nr:4-hydroxyphenylpyruvate dioxygenase [Richelia sp.]CDN12010.1 4-hydroxyphenylpyruvate dioxygenase [Richelia intracellularis]